MKHRNNNATHRPAVKTRDVAHKQRLHQRTHKQRYEERHNCAEYVAHYNLHNMGVDYE